MERQKTLTELQELTEEIIKKLQEADLYTLEQTLKFISNIQQ